MYYKLAKRNIVIGSVLNTGPWTYKIRFKRFKDLNKEKIIKHFYEKELLFSIL